MHQERPTQHHSQQDRADGGLAALGADRPALGRAAVGVDDREQAIDEHAQVERQQGQQDARLEEEA